MLVSWATIYIGIRDVNTNELSTRLNAPNIIG